jgi:hypothetical protein
VATLLVAGGGAGAGGATTGGVVQLDKANSVKNAAPPTIEHFNNRLARTMWLIILEALLALGVLVAIVWWTMFSGRKNGELDDKD